MRSGVSFREVHEAELTLLESDTRRDRARVLDLLHADFIEIGASGRRWTRDEIVDALAAEQIRDAPRTDEWRFRELATDIVLVTYRLHTHVGASLRSSVWDTTTGTPKIRFHQGTPTQPPAGGVSG